MARCFSDNAAIASLRDAVKIDVVRFSKKMFQIRWIRMSEEFRVNNLQLLIFYNLIIVFWICFSGISILNFIYQLNFIMPNTYTQIYIHVVFAVSFRDSLIHPKWESELYKYVTGIVRKKGQKMLAINGMPDHIHLLIGMTPNSQLSDLVREIKKSSTQFINERGFVKAKFNWQEGYGAFSYSRSSLKNVATYIKNQKEHHATKKFKDEFVGFLDSQGIDYKEEYLFNWLD